MSKGSGGHKPNNAKKKQRERWKIRHPLGRKETARKKRKERSDKLKAKLDAKKKRKNTKK